MDELTHGPSGARRPTVDRSTGLSLLVGAAVLLAGIAVLGVGVHDYGQEATALEDPVEVESEVTATDVERIPGARGNKRFVATATFEYQFEGASHVSDNLFPAGSTPPYETRAAAREQLSDLAAGDTVTAYVEPAAPDQAYLRPNRSGTSLALLLMGPVLALVGGLRMVQLWLYAKRRTLPM